MISSISRTQALDCRASLGSPMRLNMSMLMSALDASFSMSSALGVWPVSAIWLTASFAVCSIALRLICACVAVQRHNDNNSMVIFFITCFEDSANERSESLLSDCRVPLISCKGTAK